MKKLKKRIKHVSINAITIVLNNRYVIVRPVRPMKKINSFKAIVEGDDFLVSEKNSFVLTDKPVKKQTESLPYYLKPDFPLDPTKRFFNMK